MTTTIIFKPVSLLDRIKKAESRNELLSLMTEGIGYKYATNRTRQKWTKASISRKAQLIKNQKTSTSKPKHKTTDISDNRKIKNK